MSHVTKTVILIGITAALLAVPAMASKRYEKVKGEVVRVEQQTRNEGDETMITVRTRTGEERHMRVGRVGDCPGCVAVGDQVQARVHRQTGAGEMSGSGGSNARQIHEMAVRRGGERREYRYESGKMAGTTQRLRDGSGDGQQVQAGGAGGSQGSGGSQGGGGGSHGGGGGGGSRGGR